MSTKILTKNKPYAIRMKLLRKRPELQDPRRYGPVLKGELKELDKFMPVLMHGETFRFYEKRSGKFEVPSKHVTGLSVHFASFYSRALDMQIMCRVSPSAVFYIDQYGGFDEYVMYAPESLICKDFVASMYRRKIFEAFEKKKHQLRNMLLDALNAGQISNSNEVASRSSSSSINSTASVSGNDKNKKNNNEDIGSYIEQVKQHYWKVDNILTQEVRHRINEFNQRKMSTTSSLLTPNAKILDSPFRK